MTPPDCRTCKSWHPDPADPGYGLCRRNPPLPAAVVVASDDGRDAVTTLTLWPKTAAKGDGCGGHEPEPQPAAPARCRACGGPLETRFQGFTEFTACPRCLGGMVFTSSSSASPPR